MFRVHHSRTVNIENSAHHEFPPHFLVYNAEIISGVFHYVAFLGTHFSGNRTSEIVLLRFNPEIAANAAAIAAVNLGNTIIGSN